MGMLNTKICISAGRWVQKLGFLPCHSPRLLAFNLKYAPTGNRISQVWFSITPATIPTVSRSRNTVALYKRSGLQFSEFPTLQKRGGTQVNIPTAGSPNVSHNLQHCCLHGARGTTEASMWRRGRLFNWEANKPACDQRISFTVPPFSPPNSQKHITASCHYAIDLSRTEVGSPFELSTSQQASQGPQCKMEIGEYSIVI